MTGQAHWLTLLLFVGFAAVIGAYFAGTRLMLQRYRGFRRGFTCPRTGQEEHGTMVRDTVAKKWTGVLECSARVPGQPCSLACVPLANAKRPPVHG